MHIPTLFLRIFFYYLNTESAKNICSSKKIPGIDGNQQVCEKNMGMLLLLTNDRIPPKSEMATSAVMHSHVTGAQ